MIFGVKLKMDKKYNKRKKIKKIINLDFTGGITKRENNGGVDGTRTRDLRRDRPAL